MDNTTLPEGKTCRDCCLYYKCLELKGVWPLSVECNFVPSRFRDASQKAVVEQVANDTKQLKDAIALVRQQAEVFLFARENVNMQAYLSILEHRAI